MAGPVTRIGVVRNMRSHANRTRAPEDRPNHPDLEWAEPDTPEDLALDMQRFAAAGVDLLVVDGGDGTVREVMSALPGSYGEQPPVLAILASGKTNVLALDLGARPGWDLAEVLRRASQVEPVYKLRAPLDVIWADPAQPAVQGFILGLGAFARATQMSRAVHRMGAYHSLSVALTLAGAVFGAVFDRKNSVWRGGVRVRVGVDDAPPTTHVRFVLIATSLKRLPFGLKPFGPPREGMKVLDVDAPPRGLVRALPVVLAGRGDSWLARRGYRRQSADRLDLRVDETIIIDGEIFPGGELSVRLGAPMRFLAP